MAKINSKQKGKKGELEWVHFCKERGFPYARRSQQFAGYNGDSDVVGIPLLHCEVKRVERLNIDDAMEQAINDSEKTGETPIVAHRKNHKEWKVTMRADDFLEMYREYLDFKNIKDKEV